MSVRTRLVVSFGIISLFVAVAGTIAVYQQWQLLQEAAIQDAAHDASIIASTLVFGNPRTASSPMLDDPGLVQAYATALRDRTRRDIVIVDPKGRVIAAADPKEIGKIRAEPEVRKTVRDGMPVAFIGRSAGRPSGIREVAVPITSPGGRILGAVIYEYTPTYEETLARTRGTVTVLTAISLLTLLVALALGYATSRSIATPLRRLRDGVSRLGEGDTTERIEPRSRDELGALVEDFNAMALNLRLSRADLIAAREHARNVLKSVGEGIVGLDRDGWITFVNPMAAKMLGYDDEDLLGQHWHEFVHQAGAEGTSAPWQGSPVALTLAHGVLQQATGEVFRRKDGSSFPVEYVVTSIRNDAAVAGAVVAFRDITERLRTEEALARQAEALVRSNEDANQRRKEVLLLHQMGELLQSCATLDEAYAVFRSMIGRFFPEDAGAVYVIGASRDAVEPVATWGPAAAENRVFSPDECWALRRGRVHLVEDTSVGLVCRHLPSPPPPAAMCVPLVAHGEALGVLYVAGEPAVKGSMTEGLSEAKQALATAVAEPLGLALANLRLRETLRNQSIRDPLTGLFNRRYLEETLGRELHRADRTGHTVGMILFDIDHFKQFNDAFGHDAGDAVLAAIGTVLQQQIRQEDIGCRYGGEEFVVVLPDASLKDTVARAEELQAAVRGLAVTHRGQALGSVSLSLGVAAFPKHGNTAEPLLRAADKALYRAKHQGRARVAVA
jgi:diguanylate cyclase (GGDEF)-like protein/PAS domain S-box-containing protein